jgi:hypothetical protein
MDTARSGQLESTQVGVLPRRPVRRSRDALGLVALWQTATLGTLPTAEVE